MKKANHISRLGFAGALLLCAVVSLWTVGTAWAQTDATQYCDLSLKDCPEAYDGDTLVVPLSVISLSAKIKACATTLVDSVRGGDPPAIMFIIDHTNSMATQNDTRGNRYRVTRALIDSVYKAFPTAEVGIVVFNAGLFLNSGIVTDPNLVAFQGLPYYKPDSVVEKYMPLMPLNGPALGGGFYTGTSPTPTAYDVYRDMLYVSSGGGTAGIRNPAGTDANPILPNGSGTNVSIAFEAALEQFSRTSVAPKNQYIIFISDGRYEMVPGGTNPLVNGGCGGTDGTSVTAPSVGGGLYGNSARCTKQRDFMAGQIGTQKIPTTYTVFLSAETNLQTAANNRATLDTMSWAIRDNLYSETNSQSNIWTADGNQYNGLLTLMMENIFDDMLTQTQSNPTRMVVVSAGKTDSTGAVDSLFGFDRMLPIDTATIAPVSMGITYAVRIDSTLQNPTRDTSWTYDQRIEYNFWIRRTSNPGNNWDTRQGLIATCGGKPSIELLYGGVHVDTIKGNMSTLTLRFSKSNFFDYTPNNVIVEIRTTKGTTYDTLRTNVLTARDGAATIEWDFERLDGKPAANNKLENSTAPDSVVFIFRNPIIPLDTLMFSVPYISHMMAFDVKKEGEPVERVLPGESITIKAGHTLDISALLLDGGGRVDAGMLGTGKVTWRLDSYEGATINPGEGAQTQFMSTKVQEYVVSAEFEANGSGLKIPASFTVKVIPGDPEYLQVVFVDPVKNPPPSQVDPAILEKNKKLEISKGKEDTTLYVVERDKFGNLIGATSGSWDNVGGAIGVSKGESAFTKVWRESDAFSAGNLVIVRKGNMVDTVEVVVVGNASTAIGPNPFIPGVSDPRETLPQITRDYYKEILDAPSVGGGGGGGGGHTGILVAGTAPKGITPSGDGKHPKLATVIIYDAVGNIVFKSQPNDVTLIEDKNTFGFVWNGKNSKGRTVGPGTYLVRISVELDGDKFVEQRKIGVTKSTK